MGFFKDMGLGEKIAFSAFLPIIAPLAVVITAYEAVTGDDDKSSRRNDDNLEAEERARENARKEARKREEKELALAKMKSWNSCIDAYVSDNAIKNSFKISGVSENNDISEIDSFKAQIQRDDFVTKYKVYLNAEKSIQKLNQQIAAVDNVMVAFK
jgi:hypothetical protein